MTKKELRRAMRARNRSLEPEARAAASARIIAHMEAMPAFADARTIGLYCALPDEPDLTQALIRWSRDKRLAVPRVEGSAMRFFEYDPSTLVRGSFGIDEPGPAARLCRPEELDLLFIPGVAFTSQGLRCGRGGGYYDRYLSQRGLRALKIGICYAHQLVDDLPVEACDIGMDGVIFDY